MSDIRVKVTVEVSYTLNGIEPAAVLHMLEESIQPDQLRGSLPIHIDAWDCWAEISATLIHRCSGCGQLKSGWPQDWRNVPAGESRVRYVCKECSDDAQSIQSPKNVPTTH